MAGNLREIYFLCRDNHRFHYFRAVRALVDQLNVPHKNVVVIFDEVNMPVGSIRLRNNGSGGGQNGVPESDSLC